MSNLSFPAIKVTQPLGDFWAVSIPAKILRNCIALDPTRIRDVDRSRFFYWLTGNQRDSSNSRARDIGKYINSIEAAFPNSIIVGANFTENGPLSSDSNLRWNLKEENGHFTIEIPENQKSAVVIDGQHRLLGFDYAMQERQNEMELLCAVYFDLPQAYQAYLFATININQKRVDKSLAYEQFGYNLDNETANTWAPDKLAVYFSRKMNLNPRSPFYQHIKVAPLDAELVLTGDVNDWKVSTACIVEGILSLISTKPKEDRDTLHQKKISDRSRKDLRDDISPLRNLYKNGDDDKILATIESFFEYVKDKLWSISDRSSYLKKTLGINALFDVFKNVLQKHDYEEGIKRSFRCLDSVGEVDFSNVFFQGAGKGETRIKNVILLNGGEISLADISSEEDRRAIVSGFLINNNEITR